MSAASLPLINQENRVFVYAAATATVLAVGAVFVPYEAVRIIGMTVLTGVTYGIANDMVACRDCIEYFTLGHFWDGRNLEHRPLNTLNPTLNAIAWGAIATWHVCAIAGTFFAFIARTPFAGLALKITAVQLAPYLAIGAAIILLISHIRSRSAQKEMASAPYTKYEGVPTEYQAGWEACNVRNSTGYAALGIGGLILTVAIVAARAGLFGM
jgi:hypothetical protein